MATTREELNQTNPNRLATILSKLRFGEVLNFFFGGASSSSSTVGSAVSATVGADIGAFTDPPSAAEMALLRTFVNALKTDAAAIIVLLNQLRTAALATDRATESAVTVTANVATLAATPTSLFTVNATTATTTGVKRLLVGPITGPGAVAPKTGEAVWDGGNKVLFAAIDVVTAASFVYAKAADTTASVLQSTVEPPS